MALEEKVARLNAKLTEALKWALPSARLDVERLGNSLSGPSITPSMQEEYVQAQGELLMAETALAEAEALLSKKH